MIHKASEFILKFLFSLSASIWLHTVGFLFRKNRCVIDYICAHFNYFPAKLKPTLPQQDMKTIFDTDSSIKICEPVAADGNITLLEMYVINHLVKKYDPKTIFEIGTFDGRTTLNFALNTDPKSTLYTLDLPQTAMNDVKYDLATGEETYVNKKMSGARFINTEYENRITQLYGDSATFDLSPYFNSIDFIFLDGSHSYDYVISDSQNALKLLKNGKGVIVWHDYGAWDGVTQALDTLKHTDKNFKNIVNIKSTSLVYLEIL